jgi:hypothetical protein
MRLVSASPMPSPFTALPCRRSKGMNSFER